MKIQNVIFSLMMCVFACMPAMLYCAIKIGVDVPVELTSKPAEYLAGGLSEADVAASFNLSDIKNKRFQDAAETEIGNYIPAKANAIIFGAWTQRMGIEVSNAVFNYDCYPTFYGSNRIYLNDVDAVSYLPQRNSNEYVARWTDFANGLKRVAQQYPEKNFVVYVVQGYTEPAINPAYELVHDPLSPRLCSQTLSAHLKDMDNVHVLTHDFDDLGDYYSQFFTTDHHWNIDGAFEGYDQICSILDLTPIHEDGIKRIENYLFTGATARWGVDLLQESVFDCRYDFSNLSIQRSDGEVINGNDHRLFWNCSPLGKPYLFYDTYYGGVGNCSITGGYGNKNALLIGNSFKEALQRPLAESYASLYVSLQLIPTTSLQKTLEREIIDQDADDIVFVGNPSSLMLPDAYFELD